MKILVTGAAGFIGSHLVELCVEEGYEVVAFDRYNPNNNWGWLEYSEYKDKFDVILGDIRDYDSVFDAVKSCDGVFHLAALIGIPYSYISPLAYIRTNVEGTYNILEASCKLDIENVIITSTSETYGSAQYVPIDESHPIVGQSPYAASKISADQLAISYFRSFDLPVKIVRPFNTYGPRQSARAIIPTVISQILHGKNSIELGNLTPTRDLTYVQDTATAIIEIARCSGLYGEVTNIGNHKEISMKELVHLIADIMESEIKIFAQDARVRPPKSEVDRLLCDNSKLLRHTNWEPEISLRKGLQNTVQWMSEYLDLYKPGMYNV